MGGRGVSLSAYATVARNATSLYGTTLVTSLLGFGFWWLASQQLSPQEVGQGSALISGVQLLSMASVMGLATLSISELSRDTSRAQTLLTTALTVCIGAAMTLATACALVLPFVAPVYRAMVGDAAKTVLFVLAVVVTTCTLILDDACIGVLRGHLQLRRNTAFAALKLALVPAVAVLAPVAAGSQLLVAWVIGAMASLWFLRPLRHIGAGPRRVDIGLVRTRWREAMNHHWLNIALEMPRLTLPVMAVSVLGEEPTAALYASLMLVAFVNAVPIHFSTVLFAIAPGDVAALRHQARFTLTVSAVVSTVAAGAFLVLAPFLLGLFHDDYAVAVNALRVLGASTLLWSVKAHFIAVSRVTGRLTRASVLGTIGAVLEIAAAYLGSVYWGVTGTAVGLVAALAVEAVVLLPIIILTLRRAGRDGVPPDPSADRPAAAGRRG